MWKKLSRYVTRPPAWGAVQSGARVDVAGPLIMAAAAAAFVLWKLNLEAEGSLPAVLCRTHIDGAQTEALRRNSVGCPSLTPAAVQLQLNP